MSRAYFQNIDDVTALPEEERQRLKEVGRKFKFRTNDYYNSLIDWNNPDDPLRKLIFPDESELDENFGSLDAAAEHSDTVVKGLQHKYEKTALVLVSSVCAAYCRFCFRKRLFMEGNDEVAHDLTDALAYIAEHSEIDSVVLSGGDPLELGTGKIRAMLTALSQIPHLQTIRIDTKILAFNPYRILDDPQLVSTLASIPQTGNSRIYLITHFTHPREITPEAIRAIDQVRAANVSLLNQMPMLKGINDSSEVLTDLLTRLAFHGILPYYVFLGRPIMGNKRFSIPLGHAWKIYRDAISKCSGLAKTAKLMMSDVSGKIEIVGMVSDTIVLRYHQSPDCSLQGTIMTAKLNGNEAWLSDLDLKYQLT